MTTIDDLVQSAATMARSQTVGENVVLCKAIGRMFYVDPQDISIAPHLMINGVWEPNVTLAIAKHVKGGMRVVDIGANVGYFTILMASCRATVHAYEPNPNLVKLLRKTVNVNGYDHNKRVYIYPLCVAEASYKTTLSAPIECNGGGSMVASPPESIHYICDTVSLDAHIPLKLDFVKCDAEGAEPLVWEGMKEHWRQNPDLEVCFESITTPEYRGALYDKLSDGNWIGIVNPVGNVVPLSRDTAINSDSADMLWVRHIK